MAEYIKVAKISEVGPGQGKSWEIKGKRIAIFNVNGSFVALDDTCPHKGGPLSQGLLDDKSVTCPWHGATFALESGAVLKGPATVDIATYKTRVVGENLEVEI